VALLATGARDLRFPVSATTLAIRVLKLIHDSFVMPFRGMAEARRETFVGRLAADRAER
jgi:hypothetical protein